MRTIPLNILLISQIFGCLPLTYAPKPNGRLVLEFSVKWFLWGILYASFVVVLGFYALYNDYQFKLVGQPLLMVGPIDTVSITMYVLSGNIVVIVVVVTAIKNYSSFIQMFEMFEDIDKILEYRRKLITTRKVMVGMIIVTLYITDKVYFFLTNDHQLVFYTLTFFSQYLVATQLLQFTFVTEAFTLRINKINEELEKEEKRMMQLTVTQGQSVPGRVLTMMICYSQLEQTMKLARSFYQTQILAVYFYSFVHNIMNLYEVMELVRGLQLPSVLDLLHAIAFAAVFILHLVLLTWSCSGLDEAVFDTTRAVKRLLNISGIGPDVTEQLEAFLLQLRLYKMEFSALGYFEIHNTILTSIGGSIVTYLLIMLDASPASKTVKTTVT